MGTALPFLKMRNHSSGSLSWCCDSHSAQPTASAKARIVNIGTNLGALAVFVPQGAPMWRLGLAMGLCNIVGGWIGAHTAIRRGSRFVRVVFLVVVGGLVVKLGYDVVSS